jgi:response regulator of citrate/malate metabolism
MKKKKGQAAVTTTHPNNTGTKVQQIKGIEKILAFFRYKAEGSTLSIADATGVARCSVCYYLADLIHLGIIGYCGRKVGRTGRLMKNYTADPNKWLKRHANTQLSLFPEWEKGGTYER